MIPRLTRAASKVPEHLASQVGAYLQDFLEDLQGISGSLTSLGSKAQKVVTAPAAAVGSLRGKLSQGSLNKPLPSSTEQIQFERTTEEQEQKQEQASERNVAASDSEKSVVENSA